jgi:sigma-B regulation protein RsbU (phosphoserine phosphatase)
MGAILVQNLEARDRRLAFLALETSQKKLAQELNEASDYVQALLPKPLMDSPRTDWIFVPSAELGGDAFGYHWIDEDHFAMYLLDVCGHGVGAALLSISALNVLRSSTIPGVDFRKPEQVLGGMNVAFDMEKQNNMYFTLWYGVWNKRTQTLSCSCGGHPPALLYLPGENGAAQKLGKSGMVVGAVPDIPYGSQTLPAPVGSTLLLFSDGVYEITKPEGGMWTLDEFGVVAGQKILQPGTSLTVMADEARALYGQSGLEDDFSLVRIVF